MIVLTGEQARAHKLVDSLGNYSDALERAVKLAKATGEPVEVTTRRGQGLLSRLLEDAMESVYGRLRQALVEGASMEVRDPRLR